MMKKLLVALSIALLMAGCGDGKDVQKEAKDDPNIPLLIPCDACEKYVSKLNEKCPHCGHPASPSIVAYKEAYKETLRRRHEEEAKMRDEEEIRRRVEEEAAKPYGGIEVLAKISNAKERGDGELILRDNNITDLTPLAELTKLEYLSLSENQLTDLTPLAKLTKLETLDLSRNQLIDLTPLARLTNLTSLNLMGNQLIDISPLARLTNLKVLYLRENQITDITPLADLINLEELWFYENQTTI